MAIRQRRSPTTNPVADRLPRHCYQAVVRPHHRFFVAVLSLVAAEVRANSAIVGGETGRDAVEVLRSNLWSAILAGDVSRITAMVLLLAGPLLLLLGVMFAFRSKKQPWRAPLIGVLGMVFAAVTFGAATWGTRLSSAPDASTSTSTSTSMSDAGAHEIAWVRIGDTADALTTFDAVLSGSKAAHQPVFIDFGADWCIACKELDKTTFADPAVRAEAARFVAIKVDATNESPSLNAIQERFGVVGLPTIAFVGSDGVYLDAAAQTPRYEAVTGFVKAPEFLLQLQRVR